MANEKTMTDRQLLESMYTNMAVHEAKHEEQDRLITKMASAIWGNGKVGLTAKVYLLMGALGAMGVVATVATGAVALYR